MRLNVSSLPHVVERDLPIRFVPQQLTVVSSCRGVTTPRT